MFINLRYNIFGKEYNNIHVCIPNMVHKQNAMMMNKALAMLECSQ